MKKIVAVGILAMALIAYALIGATQAQGPSVTPLGSTIEAQVGKTFQIVIESNPTTGYSWSATFDKTSLELTKDTFKEGSTGLLGAPGVQVLEFKCLQKGTFEVNLDYMRPCEGQSVKQATFEVLVK